MLSVGTSARRIKWIRKKSAHTSGSHEGIIELDNESENVGFIVLLERMNGVWMDAHPLLRHDFRPLKWPELIYISCSRCPSKSGDSTKSR